MGLIGPIQYLLRCDLQKLIVPGDFLGNTDPSSFHILKNDAEMARKRFENATSRSK